MMKNDNRLIERYLMGELPENEKEIFEARLKTDQQLLAEFELRKMVNTAIHEKDIMDFRRTLSLVMNESPKISRFTTGKYFYWQMAAAVVVAFIIVKTIFFNNSVSKDYDILFSEYYQLYPSFNEFRNGDNQSDKSILFTEAGKNYEEKNFELAEKSLEQILRADSSEIMAKFYIAITQIEQNKLDEAYANLSWLTQHKNHLFYEQSVWYMALVCLKENKPEVTKKMLELIIRENYYCSEQARKLLRKLN